MPCSRSAPTTGCVDVVFYVVMLKYVTVDEGCSRSLYALYITVSYSIGPSGFCSVLWEVRLLCTVIAFRPLRIPLLEGKHV